MSLSQPSEKGHCLGWTKDWTLRDGPGLPCPFSLFSPSKDAWMWQASLMAEDMQVWRAAAGQSWAQSVCVSFPSHTLDPVQSPPACHRLQPGVCELIAGYEWLLLSLSWALLALAQVVSKCMNLPGSQWSCQRNHHLLLEHFGSVELDPSALFSIKRAFIANSGANVRSLWICAEGFGACWWCALFAQRWSCVREMPQNGGEKTLAAEGARGFMW